MDLSLLASEKICLKIFVIQTICQIQVEENQINISALRIKLWCGKNQENVVPWGVALWI